ncbi:MAG TPA: hypothetical protein DEF10_07645, partial [Ruminococcaceae bacterium]|nr:hypothetical protein [Oscillospiraceae bacterium]
MPQSSLGLGRSGRCCQVKYVIIGASAAGLAAAEQIRKTDPAGVVTLLTRETDLPYSRPSISYYLKGLVRRG